MLASLCRYYDCLVRQSDSGLVPDGYSKEKVNMNLVLGKDGQIKNILPYTALALFGKKEKEVSREELFPFRIKSPSISAETIENRGKYLFGLEYDKETGAYCCTKNSLLAFEKCKEKNLEFLLDINSPVSEAFKAFMTNWNSETESNNPILLTIAKIFDTAKFVISTEDDYTTLLNNDSAVKEKWEKINRESKEVVSDDAVSGQCSVTGKVGEIARIHNNLKGISGGLATGVNLVCMKTSAFWSYGKETSYNACVSLAAMEKYTEAFNYLSSSREHKQNIDDMTLLFWVETTESEKKYLDCVGYGLGSFGSSTSEESDERKATEEQLSSIFSELAQGKEADWKNIGIDETKDFYILGLKPNASRLAVKMFEKNSFGKLMKNVATHQKDSALDEDDKQLSVWQITKALQSFAAPEPISPDLTVEIFKSIISGSNYPYAMLSEAVRRAKTDADNTKKKLYSVNKTRMRIIKAYIMRRKNRKGEYEMLSTDREIAAYNCGRLFAMLENIQRCALGDLNSSIKDKFFSSACGTPSLVFPRLIKLAQPHLKKISSDKGGRLAYSMELGIGEIAATLKDGFPKTLDVVEQGLFELGYYSQKFKKTENVKEGE